MQSLQDQIKVFTQLGLTFCEARVLLALVHTGTCPAKTISKASHVSKPDVYRALAILQERALVEKVISTPAAMFKAVSPSESLSVLIKDKEAEHNLLKEKAEQLKHDLDCREVKVEPQEAAHQFVLVSGKMAELERRRKEIKATQKNVDAIIPWKRFPKTMFFYGDDIIEALRRNVKVRVLLEKPDDTRDLTEYYIEAKNAGFYRIRYTTDTLRESVTIYDKKNMITIISPRDIFGDADILWTSNASLIYLMENYFEMLWAKAIRYERLMKLTP
ncbi:MAG: TrmB family transcriptional regulator [Candidatus Bathyarchaeia archaeon]